MAKIKPEREGEFRPPQLDWRAYFLSFCAEHGNNPVDCEGRLLFADGWRYSSSDYRGPEWSPPSDPAELLRLKRLYWKKRLAIVEGIRRELQHARAALVDSQAVRSVALMQRVSYRSEDAEGRPVWKSEPAPLDLGALEARLESLAIEVASCFREIAALGEEQAA